MAMYSVDRIEGAFAVLVGESQPDMTVELNQLPAGVKEGTVLRFENGTFSVDANEEQQRRSRIFPAAHPDGRSSYPSARPLPLPNRAAVRRICTTDGCLRR